MAVFKVISVPQKYADEDAYADLIHYCIRPMKTPGNFIDGFGVLPQLAVEQMQMRIACLPAGSWHSPAALDHQL